LTFADIFAPLFEVTVDPSSNPKLHVFLQSCVGFDMVDDESLRERPYNESLPCPDEWDYEYDPPYALFAYYLYANLCALNKLRSFRGLSQFPSSDAHACGTRSAVCASQCVPTRD